MSSVEAFNLKVAAPARRLSPPLKWHGGKYYLAQQLVAAMPPHEHYTEAFAGGLGVLLVKDPTGVAEVVNDLDEWLSNFWAVLRDPDAFDVFHRHCEATPISQPLFEQSLEVTSRSVRSTGLSPALAAWWFFIKARQSMAGRLRTFSPLSRTRTRGGMSEQASNWLSTIDGLPLVHARMRRVVVLNQPGVEVIRKLDGPSTLHYVDPPYLDDTRATPDVYAHEMTRDDHIDLLDTLEGCQGKVMLSGYDCQLYKDRLGSWHRLEFDLPNNAAGGASKRTMTEVVWCNFEPAVAP